MKQENLDKRQNKQTSKYIAISVILVLLAMLMVIWHNVKSTKLSFSQSNATSIASGQGDAYVTAVTGSNKDSTLIALGLKNLNGITSNIQIIDVTVSRSTIQVKATYNKTDVSGNKDKYSQCTAIVNHTFRPGTYMMHATLTEQSGNTIKPIDATPITVNGTFVVRD
jgi:hypothetical protein